MGSGECTDTSTPYNRIRNRNLHRDICSDNWSNDMDINNVKLTAMSKITIDHNHLLRIAYYNSSHYPQEALTEELFNETYGSVMGKHYFDKWQHIYKHDILKMVVYFGRDTTEGQKFADMLAVQINKYEKRIGQ